MSEQYIDSCPLDLSDDDILKAMKDIVGYLDITPGDVKEIYKFAYNHAIKRLTSLVKAKDVMTRDVISVNTDTSLDKVADILNSHLISGVPVINDDKTVAGIISEKDFLFHLGNQRENTFMGVVVKCLRNEGCIAITMRKKKAGDIMKSPAITVNENSTIFEIAKVFSEKNINRTPVVDQSEKLIGIITRTDIVRSTCTTRT